MYTFAVKIDATKTVQIKCNNYLSTFQLHFIINFVLTEPKLPSEISACSISLFMNVIMAKTGSTAKYIRQMKYFQQSTKISSHQPYRAVAPTRVHTRADYMPYYSTFDSLSGTLALVFHFMAYKLPPPSLHGQHYRTV